MKSAIYVTIILLLLITNHSNAQQDINSNYRIYLTDGKSQKDPKYKCKKNYTILSELRRKIASKRDPISRGVPIVLEEENEKDELVYELDGKKAIKKLKYYKRVNPNDQFSFKDIYEDFNYKSIIVDIDQKEAKLVLILQGDVSKMFKNYNDINYKGKKRRLIIDATEGVKITKTSARFSAISIPLKVFLSNDSDSLKNFTNNIETDVNVALTFGKSWEKYSFKKGRKPILTNTINAFGFFGINRLSLTKLNTDQLNDGDTILSFRMGAGLQFGYGKLGASLLIGVDLPTSSIGDNWVFGKQPWIGIGLGYSIFE